MKVLKGFLMFSAGCLMLAAAWRLLAGDAQASIVEPSGAIVGLQANVADTQLSEGWVLTADGRMWFFDYYISMRDGRPFFRNEPVTMRSVEIPVPLTEVKFWSGNSLVTRSDEVWTFDSAPNGEPAWQNLGTPPGIPVSAESRSLGGLKGSYKPVGQ